MGHWALALALMPAAVLASPNILFLMTDSQDGRLLDPTDRALYPAQNMPNLERLARSGVNFVRAYTPAPQCTPARASLYSGLRTDRNRVWANGHGLARVPATGGLDSKCTDQFDNATCLAWANEQNVTSTWNDTLANVGYNVTILGKVRPVHCAGGCARFRSGAGHHQRSRTRGGVTCGFVGSNPANTEPHLHVRVPSSRFLRCTSAPGSRPQRASRTRSSGFGRAGPACSSR